MSEEAEDQYGNNIPQSHEQKARRERAILIVQTTDWVLYITESSVVRIWTIFNWLEADWFC